MNNGEMTITVTINNSLLDIKFTNVVLIIYRAKTIK